MDRRIPLHSGTFYHVYNRGNDRSLLFRSEQDFLAFQARALALAVKYSVEVLIYVLMPNHYHFILRQWTDNGIPRMMGSLATAAARRYNLKYGRTGHLFQGPYKYKHVPEERLWKTAAYIHLNPVRAGFVKHPEEWPHSNYPEICRASRGPKTERWWGYYEHVESILRSGDLE